MGEPTGLGSTHEGGRVPFRPQCPLVNKVEKTEA
jgi:hypothetical protein